MTPTTYWDFFLANILTGITDTLLKCFTLLHFKRFNFSFNFWHPVWLSVTGDVNAIEDLKFSDMKKSSNIASVETKTGFHERQIELFIKNNLPPKLFPNNKLAGMGSFAQSHTDIECCAAELPVNGIVEFFLSVENSGSLKHIGYPVTSRFIVFCTRQEVDDYKVSWICSLS